MRNIVWNVCGNIYHVDFENHTCKVVGVSNYKINSESDLRTALSQLVGTAKYYGIRVPEEVKDFLYR